MKNIIKYTLSLLLSTSISVLAAQSYSDLYFKAAGSPMNPKVQASWNHFHTIAGIEKLCKDLAAAYPGLVKLESIGKSVGGRDIWTMTISDFSKGDPNRKPTSTETKFKGPKWLYILHGT